MQALAHTLQVRIGSLGDPDDLPGLAHFTEHMLFYASEKYPLEDEYSKFVVRRLCHAIFCLVNSNISLCMLEVHAHVIIAFASHQCKDSPG